MAPPLPQNPPGFPPSAGDDWIGLSAAPLPVAQAMEWVARPDCGAVVMFTGVVRDHSEGRAGVSGLSYEAYEGVAQTRMAAVAADARSRWPDVGRIVLLHRVGDLSLGETAVVVAVSSPHRASAFDAARASIDTLKAEVPIWKQEHWGANSGWAVDAEPLPAARG